MNAQLFLNNFDSQFIAAVKSTPTTGTPASELDYGIVRLPQSAGAILGTLTNGDYYILTAFKRSGSNETAVEIMKVTNVDTSVINETRLTVQRGQESTSPQAYISGDYISLRETAAGLSGMLQKSGNLAGLADPAAARANIGAAPLANPSFTGGVSTPAINGGGSSGFKNKIINGCMRISKKGNGAAALGSNNFGADGLTTIIGGWSAITGSISRDTGVTDARTSSGSIHYTSLSSATGSSGYIIHQYKIEAADAQELGGKTVTVSARVSAITKAADTTYIRVHKAGALNDFASPVLVSTGGSVNVPATNTGTPVSHTFALSAADAQNGILVEVVCGYTPAVASSLICLIADVMCSAATGVDVFEPRQIAIEELLRQRYFRQQAIWVGTSTARTVMPIGMVKTPTLSGGGAGFVATGTDKDTLVCYQTTAGLQTITFNSELA